MVSCFELVRNATTRLAEAANGAVRALNDGRIEQEPAFTDRMLGRIEQAMDEYEYQGVRWTAKTLTDRGPNAQESRFGADFAGVMNLQLARVEINTGFLAQAKLIQRSQALPEAEWERLRRQCRAMLRLSSAAFVFLYSRRGIFVVPAIAVLSTSERNPDKLFARSLAHFFEDHLGSFLGDPRLGVPSIEAIEELYLDGVAEKLLYLGAEAV